MCAKNNLEASKNNKWIDISQPLTNAIAHWPGDTPFLFDINFTKEQTGSVNIGKITTSLHTGTHVDAPYHFINDGEKIDELDINVFIGKCRLIDVTGHETIDAETLMAFDLQGVHRVLLKTSVTNNPNVFPQSIPYITEDGADYLGKQGIILVGVDVPSVDPLDSKELNGHHGLHERGIHILENVMLADLSCGDYELIALPLPIQGADGSPVRAVVRPL